MSADRLAGSPTSAAVAAAVSYNSYNEFLVAQHRRDDGKSVEDWMILTGHPDPGVMNWWESLDSYKRRVGFQKGFTHRDPFQHIPDPYLREFDRYSLEAGLGVLGGASLTGAAKLTGTEDLADVGLHGFRSKIMGLDKALAKDVLSGGSASSSSSSVSTDFQGYKDWIAHGKALGYTKQFYKFVKFGKGHSGFFTDFTGYKEWLAFGKPKAYTRHLYSFFKYGKKK